MEEEEVEETNITRFRLGLFDILVQLMCFCRRLYRFIRHNFRSKFIVVCIWRSSWLFLFILCDTRANIVIGTRKNVSFIAELDEYVECRGH